MAGYLSLFSFNNVKDKILFIIGMNDASRTNDASSSVLPSTTSLLRARTSKADLLDNLIHSLDTIIFLQIAAAYYLDNLTILFFARAFCQSLYISPRPPPFSPIAAQLPPVLFANAVCFLTHALQTTPEVFGKHSRGYQHGGLLVDFVGELGPVSKWRQLLLDIFILGLQLLALIVSSEKQGHESHATQSERRQDLDAEEAGVRRSQEGNGGLTAEDGDSIEMQNLLPTTRTEHVASNGAEEMLLEINLGGSLRMMARKTTENTSSGREAGASETGAISNIIERFAAARARVRNV